MSTYTQLVQARFCTQDSLEKRTAMKKLGAVLILCCCALPFSACAIRETGPCYGVGCPALTSSKAPAASPASQSAPAQDPSPTANAAPAEKKHHHKFSLRHPF